MYQITSCASSSTHFPLPFKSPYLRGHGKMNGEREREREREMALCCCVLSSNPVAFVSVSLPRCPRPLLNSALMLPPQSSFFSSAARMPLGSCGGDLNTFGKNSAYLRLFERIRKHWQWRKGRSFRSPHSDGWKVSADAAESSFANKRKIVEHIVLLKAKSDLLEDDEKDMLDSLYTSQYHMSGILAISLGRIADPNDDGCTHGVYMRFQRKEDLAKFYQNPLYRKVLEEHVLPHCHDLICLDYESEVEDDILPIFRRGEAFEYGVEFLLLISVYDDAVAEDVEDAFCALVTLTEAFSFLIVQSTQGSKFSTNDGEYTHGVVIRFPSYEALEEFRESSEYADMWLKKFKPITRKSLAVYFLVDPVGAQVL
ncbi:stress-response A/B barrel domain-containing protein UP3 isoform X2 [Nymphaea colorata]|uniref:stress-response A/B barrel domain-containing protein UP3 isoform X2 n=1 Tax=Nymphaea colorata TaxID=210225 RepID=UPI00129ED2E5|nr:stress-response A/B barrel domain-containing protein UP3 isoform X2 [Nymphaea colorata]